MFPGWPRRGNLHTQVRVEKLDLIARMLVPQIHYPHEHLSLRTTGTKELERGTSPPFHFLVQVWTHEPFLHSLYHSSRPTRMFKQDLSNDSGIMKEKKCRCRLNFFLSLCSRRNSFQPPASAPPSPILWPGKVQKLARTPQPHVLSSSSVFFTDAASAFTLNQTIHRNLHLFHS